jgi:formyl-CoA transferase
LRGSLDGILVLDLSQFAAGPYCTMLLGDAGARIIKVEPPGRGEPYRHEGPVLEGSDGSQTGGFFVRFNRNKESITIDLKSPKGIDIFKRIAKVADVVVQNYKPETVDRLGIGYSQLKDLNPGLVYASISGFGQPGVLESPYWRWPAFAVVAEAMGGVMDRIGDATCPPHWSGVSVGDLYAGGLALGGIVMALLERERTGLGQHVDIAMVDCMVSLNERSVFTYGATGISPQRGADPELAPFGAFQAQDGWMVIGVIGNPAWKRFCQAIGRAELLEDQRLGDGLGRGRHLDDIIAPAISSWLRDKTRAQASEILHAWDVPAAPVETAKDVYESPHVKARQMLVDVDYDVYGHHKVVASPIKMGDIATSEANWIPRLGQHTEEILRTICGIKEEEYASLMQAGIV